jgi:hypothetical protein
MAAFHEDQHGTASRVAIVLSTAWCPEEASRHVAMAGMMSPVFSARALASMINLVPAVGEFL